MSVMQSALDEMKDHDVTLVVHLECSLSNDDGHVLILDLLPGKSAKLFGANCLAPRPAKKKSEPPSLLQQLMGNSTPAVSFKPRSGTVCLKPNSFSGITSKLDHFLKEIKKKKTIRNVQVCFLNEDALEKVHDVFCLFNSCFKGYTVLVCGGCVSWKLNFYHFQAMELFLGLSKAKDIFFYGSYLLFSLANSLQMTEDYIKERIKKMLRLRNLIKFGKSPPPYRFATVRIQVSVFKEFGPSLYSLLSSLSEHRHGLVQNFLSIDGISARRVPEGVTWGVCKLICALSSLESVNLDLQTVCLNRRQARFLWQKVWLTAQDAREQGKQAYSTYKSFHIYLQIGSPDRDTDYAHT
eukprot:snap_masked-scaffold_8-processed-gene-8.28-mRNA-1 protein AED:0.28 eAED:1.00 QI:0/-1/0/1/-1/1/1/0/351